MFKNIFNLFLIAIFYLVIDKFSVRCQIILAPSKFHLGKLPNKLLLISLHKPTSAKLSLSFEKDFKETLYEDENIQFTNYISELNLPINIIKNQNVVHHKKIYMKVSFPNNQIIKEQFNLTHDGLIYFQTDKPIYRTTETVRFRILQTNRSLSPISGKCKLTIKNHQNIKLDFTTLTLQPPYYFAEYSFDLPLTTKEGIWTAELSCGVNFFDKLNFEVKDYINPIMKIDIQTPRVHLCSSKIFDLSVNATYMFGKPVKGYVFFEIGLINKEKKITTDVWCLENGYLHLPIREDFCKNEFSLPSRLSVVATVTDISTNTKDKAKSNYTILTPFPYKISLRHTIQFYKPKLANYIVFEVVDFNEKPVPNVPLTVDIVSRYGHNIKPYIVTLNDTELKTDNGGLVIFTFQLNETVGKLKVTVQTNDPKYEDTEQTYKKFSLLPFDSSENSFILISNKKKLFYQAGDRFQSSIVYHGNIDPNNLFLVVSTKGSIIIYEKLNSKTIEFLVVNRMMPSVRILVLGITKDEEIIADSFHIYVKQKNCGVKIELDPKQGKVFPPGANITLNLKGDKNDVVALSAVDESVYILKNDSSLTRTRYQQSLFFGDFGYGPGDGKNSLDIIQKAGFKIIGINIKKEKYIVKRNTHSRDCLIYNNYCCLMALQKSKIQSCKDRKQIVKEHTKQPECAEIFLACCLCISESIFQTSTVDRKEDLNRKDSSIFINMGVKASPSNDIKVDEINTRYDFRDSWLFDLIFMNQSSQTFNSQTPHSITSWKISSLSISQKDGLCFHQDHRITVYKPFFLHVSMPQYIVLNEHTEIRATIFNYLNENLNTFIYFFHVDGICSDASQSMDKVKINLNIQANSSVTKAFTIVPVEVGTFTIKIMASSHLYKSSVSDIILRNLTVVFPGIVKEHAMSFDLDPGNRAKRETKISNQQLSNRITSTVFPEKKFQKIDISFDKNQIDEKIVPGTVRHKLSFIGQKFSPKVKSIEELDNLIKKPKGCGEQNMYYMAFNLYTLMYLDEIGKLNYTTKIRGINYLKRAFRQQLNFRKEDGSFSAFINRESSVWLTAFISKVFCQSGPLLKDILDNQIIIDALKWLQNKQFSNGSWAEIYPILHEKALGGANQGSHTLTAYITIALNECHSYFQSINQTVELNDTSKRAQEYLISQIRNIGRDSYSLSIIIYSLLPHLQKKTLRNLIIELINHHEKRKDPLSNYLYYDNDYSIEATSYALLSLTKTKSKFPITESISNWLSSQQKDGTFDNTQDTIVALEALSNYHATLNKRNDEYKLLANVSFNSRPKRSIEFNNENIDLLHTIEVDENTNNIDIVTMGNGFGKLELLTVYNVYEESYNTCSFDLQIDLKESKPQFLYNNFNESFFFDDDSLVLVQKKLGIDRMPQVYEVVTSTVFENICKKHKYTRVKRAFWTNLLKRFQSNTSNDSVVSFKNVQNDMPHRQTYDDDFVSFDPLPDVGIENPVVRILNICFRRLHDEDGMVILEIGLLSGYKVVESDLKKLKDDNSYRTFIGFYEIVSSKVIFYLKNIPSARNICLYFRIYQHDVVEEIESALVNIYDYYKKGSSCSRLYTDIGITKLNYHWCDPEKNEACKCIINKKCPRKIIEEIESIFRLNITKAFEIYKRKICSHYSTVILGKISDKREDPKDKKFHILKITILRAILASPLQIQNKNLQIRLNSRCDVFHEGTEMLLMTNDRFNSGEVPLLDGRSIFHNYNSNKVMLDVLHEMLDNDYCS